MSKNTLYNFSLNDDALLDIINTTFLSKDDIKWLKNKRWFKRFIKIYTKELKKRYENKPKIAKQINEIDEEIEILDFTKTIDISSVNDIVNASNKARKKVLAERIILSSIIISSVMLIIMLLVILINWYIENKLTNNLVTKVNKSVKIENVTTTTKVNETKEEKKEKETLYSKYGNMDMMNVDFNELLKINSDTKGWIKVNGTKINYPFVHTNDNDFYLEHSFDKSYNKKGWVFLDYRNDIDNLSNNSVLYAHGLLNNVMFGTLKNVVKESWYNNKSNRIIKISTLNNNQLWEVFSTYTIEPESYYITTKFNTNEEYRKFISKIKERSVYDYNVDVSVDDKILTLSSCYDKQKRVVLHAKLIEFQNK